MIKPEVVLRLSAFLLLSKAKNLLKTDQDDENKQKSPLHEVVSNTTKNWLYGPNMDPSKLEVK